MSAALRIGALRHRIMLQTPIRLADGIGGAAVTWLDAGESWARIEAGPGREDAPAGRLEGRLTYTVTLRWRAGITPAMRLKWGTRLLAIRAVYDADSRRVVTLACEEEGL